MKVSSRADIYALAGLAGLAGLGLVAVGLTRGGSSGVPQPCSLKPGETLVPSLVAVPAQTIPLAAKIPLTVTPHGLYQGPGRNAYTYASLRQFMGGSVVTVYASGIGNVFLTASSAPTSYPLVPANEPQLCGAAPGPVLTLFPWSATSLTPCGSQLQPPMCGAPAMAGPADLYLEVYEDQVESGHVVDAATGDSSPSCACASDAAGQPCRMRCPVSRVVYRNAILFQ